ncbi:D-alanyl-D-alanine carboxypeptidase [Alphaproteobacteria bacterium KMM 3653]|uniref:D-alanyl-D-alanine carboxypeptidase n=1 Tax=Harenicola maris TaxID=2841044 RepID=A0AAP2G4I1_9RHOB|nr:D-alanyl-D-alanine carboxypeptidase [Harenicola maris]
MTLGHKGRFGLILSLILVVLFGASIRANAAPYAAMVIDARSGKVLHARNADTRLHPASLTKMMTLYVTFEAIRLGEISLDTKVKISKKAAAEPPSKLGLRAGQSIELRYLIRAASVKSANDAATALGEAVSGSEAAFARRMTRTAQNLGMTKTTFKNAHGLTESGHLSTARDMTKMGRALFYHYPEYYNLFSRRTTDTKVKTVSNTNTRFLNAYKGADGIKTGYTRAAGFNLVASAERGNERIITTVFGGTSTAARNAKVAELMDLGFKRAPTRVAVRKPARPANAATEPRTVIADNDAEGTTAPSGTTSTTIAKGKTIRVSGAPRTSKRPIARPLPQAIETPPELLLAALQQDIEDVVAEVAAAPEMAVAATNAKPKARPAVASQSAAPQVASAGLLNAPALLAPNIKPAARAVMKAPEPMKFAGGPATSTRAKARPTKLILAAANPARTNRTAEPKEQKTVVRASTSGGRHWAISVGKYGTRYKAEKVLLKTALKEIETLGNSTRKVVNRKSGWDATFAGLSERDAELACRRLQARGTPCQTLNPGS